MRIISGNNRGKQIRIPGNFRVRPTTDFAKESLFNILTNNFDFEECKVLDLFSGTGSISYEFGSRGAYHIRAVELNNKQANFIQRTGEAMQFPNFRSIHSDAFRFLRATTETYDIIFADPPYEMEGFEKIPQLVFERELLREEGWLIVEHSANTDLSMHEHFKDRRKYGHVNFSIFYK